MGDDGGAGAAKSGTAHPQFKSVGAFKWGLVRHLNDKGVLMYSLHEREHVKLQAELRNATKSQRFLDRIAEGGGADDDDDDQVAWYLLDDESTFRRYWHILMSIFIVYSVLVIPYRMGFQADAEGGWLVLVRA
jgi:hypothetical protein